MKSASLRILMSLVVTGLAWFSLVHAADTLPPFVSDEIANDQSTLSLFNGHPFQNDLFGLVYSSGIAVTWPVVIGWKLGGSLLTARIASAFFSWLMATLLGYSFLRRERFSKSATVVLVSFLWALTITSPFALPYWQGFIYNLGELNGILLLGFALLIYRNNSALSIFLMGIATWHGKYIYLPLTLLLLLSDAVIQGGGTKVGVMRRFCLGIVVFSIPFAMWVGWLWLRFGRELSMQWLTDQFGWLNYMKQMDQKNANALPMNFNIFSRLKSPELEWVHYSTGTKIKNVLLSIGSVIGGSVGLLAVRKNYIQLSKSETMFMIAANVALFFYTVWYFFFHPFMWQRHFQPALYLGFACIVFWLVKSSKRSSNLSKFFLIAGLAGLVFAQSFSVIKSKLFETDMSYARSCKDLHSYACMGNIEVRFDQNRLRSESGNG